MQLPEEERSAHDRTWLTNTLCTLLGGRVAEEIVFEQMTTGAGNDIERRRTSPGGWSANGA